MNKAVEQKASVARNTLIVLAFSLLTKMLSLVRESTVAAYAGTSIEADAYYMVSSLFVTLELGLSTSIFQSFFPIYRQLTVKSEDAEQVKRFTNTAFSLLVICAFVLAVFELLGRELLINLIAPGFTQEAKQLSTYLIWFSAPMLVFVVAAECISAVLRAHNRFAQSQVRESATHIAAILSVVLLYRSYGVKALGIGMLLGSLARLLIQLPALNRVHKLRPAFDFKNPDILEMLRRIPAILISASSTQIKSIIGKMIASLLPTGTVSALNYGHRLESALGGLLSTAMATGMYPEMVALFVKNEKEKLSKMLYRSILVFALIVIPVCVGGFFTGEAIVSVVYQRGAFGANEVQTTAYVFMAYLMGTFFHGVSSIVSNIFFSAGNTRLPMIFNCIDLVLYTVLSLILREIMGVVGLALAASVSTIIVCCIRFAAARKYLCMPGRGFWSEMAKFAAGSLLAGIVSGGLIARIGVESQLLKLCSVIAVFAPIYAVFLLLTKSTSLNDGISMVKRKLLRKRATK